MLQIETGLLVSDIHISIVRVVTRILLQRLENFAYIPSESHRPSMRSDQNERDRRYMQYTTQRVYSERDLFKALTSMNIARDHHNRIIHQFIEL